MNNKIFTVTIGISALNEEANIGLLLAGLLKQRETGYKLDKIIVVSDGSTDQTPNIVKKFKNEKIILIDDKKRRGLSFRQNQIFQLVDSNIVVLIQADVLIKDTKFLSKIIKPITDRKADLVSAAIHEIKPQSFLEKALFESMQIKREIFESYNSGLNLYTCYGPARAFSKQLYKKIKFKDSIGEDAYSYLYTTYHNLKYVYSKDSVVYYKLPNTLSDHKKQSIRYFQSQKKFINEFGENFVASQYYLPKKDILLTFLKFIRLKPIPIACYIVLVVFIKLKSVFSADISDQWQVSSSSKNLKGGI